MKSISMSIILLVPFFFAACGDARGRYAPVATSNAVFLCDTETGKLYSIPPQYHEGSDPKKDVPAKWKLAVEF